MGLLSNVKARLTGAVDDHGEKIADGLDKAGDVIDKKIGNAYGDKIDAGVESAKDALDGLDGKNDDIA